MRCFSRVASCRFITLILIIFFAIKVYAVPNNALKPKVTAATVLDTALSINSSGASWSSLSIEVINSQDYAVEVRDLKVSFISPVPVNSMWGGFSSISYPSAIEVGSVKLSDSEYRVSATLRFLQGSWVKTTLQSDEQFALNFGLPLLATVDTLSDITALPHQPEKAEGILAPYKSVIMNARWENGNAVAMESLTALAEKSGNWRYTLAFILGDQDNPESCHPLWSGQPSMSIDDAWGKKEIDEFQAAGGELIISFGGEAYGHTYLSQNCQTAEALFQQYLNVVKTYGVKYLDFDIEMGREDDSAAMDRMITALARLQAEVPDLKISFTLAGGPANIKGFHLVEQAKDKGIQLASVNVMTMNFGQWYHDHYGLDTAGLSKLTVDTLKAELATAYPEYSSDQLYHMIGMIPMPGVNGVAADTLSLEQSGELASWAREKNLGFLSFWSVDRDHSCDAENVSAVCTGARDGKSFQNQSWDYSAQFLKFFEN